MKCDFVMQCYAKPHTICNVFYDATALDKQIIFQLRQWTSVLHVTLRKLEIVIAIKKTPFVFVFNDQVVARVVAHYCIRAQTNFVLFCLPISLGVGVIVITLQWFNQYYCVDINDKHSDEELVLCVSTLKCGTAKNVRWKLKSSYIHWFIIIFRLRSKKNGSVRCPQTQWRSKLCATNWHLVASSNFNERWVKDLQRAHVHARVHLNMRLCTE